MAGNDVFLYSGQANPSDVKLRDPTTTSGPVAYSLSGATGSYALTGQNGGFKVGHVLSGSVGVYALSGQAATLTYAPGSVAYALSGAAGAYALTGQGATFGYAAGATEVMGGGGSPAGRKARRKPRLIFRDIPEPEEVEQLPEFDLEALLEKLDRARDAKLEAEAAIIAAKTTQTIQQARAQYVWTQRDEKRILATLEELDIVMIAALIL